EYYNSSSHRSDLIIKQIITTTIKIQNIRYGMQKYKTFADDMGVNDEKAEIDLKQRGYLFLAQSENLYELEQQAKLQHEHHVPSELLSPEELLKVIPELNTDDLVGGLYRSEEHTSELQSRFDLVCRLLLEKKKGQ